MLAARWVPGRPKTGATQLSLALPMVDALPAATSQPAAGRYPPRQGSVRRAGWTVSRETAWRLGLLAAPGYAPPTSPPRRPSYAVRSPKVVARLAACAADSGS